MIVGYSVGQGIGTALLIPPVYILATVFTTTLKMRARAFGAISAAAGIGSAAGPLIGGLLTSSTSWRVVFAMQALLVLLILYLARRIAEPPVPGARPSFDLLGAALSAAGLFFIVIGILQAGTYGWVRANQDFVVGETVLIPEGSISPVWLIVLIGAVLLFWFFRHIGLMERAGKEPLLPTRMFQNRVSNLGLVTQGMQWLVLLGLSFVVSVFLQTVRRHTAIETGLILTPATIGILVASLGAGRFAQRRAQATLIRAGFVTTIAGIAALLLLAPGTSNMLPFVPGLLLVGLGVGVMMTSSVNVVQSSFPEEDQGEISGLSRSVSNLGSSLGVAIAGTVIVASLATENAEYALALIVLMLFAGIGLIAALMLPVVRPQAPAPETTT
jgi:MFS family permease